MLNGIIAITCQVEDSSWLEECKTNSIPLVLIHDNIREDKLKNSSVVSFIRPNLNALNELVNHLIKDHHRRNICVVMASAKNHLIRQEKLKYITRALQQSGVPFDERKHLFLVSEYSCKEGGRIVEEIREVNPGIDAIISLADVTAVGIKQKLKDLGIDSVLVTGFDNIELAEQFDLTSIDQQLKITGDRALLALDNAIKNEILTFRETTYIPTTLIVRGSCCIPEKLLSVPKNSIQRYTICYIVKDKRIGRISDNIRNKIHALELANMNTIELMGRAPLYPLHITIKGIFQLSREIKLSDFISELKRSLALQKQFSIKTEDVVNYPEGAFSIVFDNESINSLKQLQQIVLMVVEKFRKKKFIEPEFRQYLSDSDEVRQENVLKFGEPFINDQFYPHLTLISGIRSDADYNTVEQIIEDNKFGRIEITVNELMILYETTLGGCWRVLSELKLD